MSSGPFCPLCLSILVVPQSCLSGRYPGPLYSPVAQALSFFFANRFERHKTSNIKTIFRRTVSWMNSVLGHIPWINRPLQGPVRRSLTASRTCRHPQALHRLNLRWNNIQSECCAYIGEMLRHNQVLLSISFSSRRSSASVSTTIRSRITAQNCWQTRFVSTRYDGIRFDL